MEFHGDLYIIAVQRIPAGQDYEDPVGASNGSISGPRFDVGIVHTEEDDEPVYCAIQNGQVTAKSDSLSGLADKLLEMLKVVIPVDEGEAADLHTVFCADDETEWDFDEDVWSFRTGWGGEVSDADDSFDGGIAVSVMPVYGTTVGLSGCGSYDDDPPDRDEFGGLRRR